MPLQPETFVEFGSPMPLILGVHEDHKIDLATEILNSGGTIRLQAMGTSMLPSLWPSDIVVVESKAGKELVPGDIVLVAREGRFFVHRLIKMYGSHYITRGDSVPQNDPPAIASELLGRVSAIHRKSRVIIPYPRISLKIRTLAWIFCHWDFFSRIALRVHSLWQNHTPFDPSQEKTECLIRGLETTTPRFRHE
jgi:Peptidase S24-like